jgi:uncharacterized membrane protein/nitrite reductase/ring-hydroxylating ferredoxin subunit
MRSTANIKSHPIHPILVTFPISFFTATLLFDILFFVYGTGGFENTALYLNIAGIVSALAAAIPGAIDYFFTVPPKSSGKKRATKHALINISIILIFTGVLIARLNSTVSTIILICAEAIAVGLLGYTGWLGGTLVYRNQIGVDHRYAGAGKWNEERISKAKGKIQVALADELELNQMKLVHISGKRIAIGRTEKGYVAFEDRCTHRGGSLSDGVMICGTVQCPWHGSQFNVNTGEVNSGPARAKIKTYSIIEQDGIVFIDF